MSKAAQYLSSSGVGDTADPDIRAQMCSKSPPRTVPVPDELLAGQSPRAVFDKYGIL